MSDTPPAPTREDFQAGSSRNPFGTEVAITRPVGSLANAEQQRSIAEVQARMIIARSNPRDPIRCMDLILRDCTRSTLAEKGLYQYARGGSSISGPSIRLAEAIAQRWGNIASGIKELSRSGGYSECVAYAWDLESGYYDERQYQVRHWRDTKSGGYAITDERDIYELIANMGQRRKRAVLLTVIPGDVVEAAQEQCEQTLHVTADTSPDALNKVLDAFEQFGITKAQLEKRCQCRFEAVRPAQIVQLRKIYASLKDGMSDPGDWFEATSGAWAAADKVHEEVKKSAPVTEAKTRTTRKAAAKEAAPSTPADDGVPWDRFEDQGQTTKQAEVVKETVTATASEIIGEKDSPMTFTEWLVDGEGEALPDEDGVIEAFTDPVAFARAYVAAKDSMFPADVELFEKANKEAIVKAQIASTEVARILVGPKQEATPEDDGSLFGSSLPVDPAFVAPPAKPVKAEYEGYLERLKGALWAASNAADLTDIRDKNAPAYEKFPPKHRLAALELFANREKELAPAPARDAPTQTADDIADGLLRDIEGLETAASVDAWRSMGPVKAELAKLEAASLELYQNVMTAAAAHQKRLTPAEPTVQQLAEEMKASVLSCKTLADYRAYALNESNIRKGKTIETTDAALWAEVVKVAKAHGDELKKTAGA